MEILGWEIQYLSFILEMSDADLVKEIETEKEIKVRRLAASAALKPKLHDMFGSGATLYDDGEKIAAASLPSKEAIRLGLLKCKNYLPAQSYGLGIESAIRTLFGMAAVHAGQEGGDAISAFGQVEIKISLSDNGSFSIQQVRTERDIPYYLLLLYDMRSEYIFMGMIPKEVIMTMLGSQSHGTKSSKKKADEFALKSLSVSKKGVLSQTLQRLERYNFWNDY